MDTEGWIFFWWVISGFIGCLIGHFKGQKGAGLVMGFLFGPIGWILLLFDAGWGTILVLVLLTLLGLDMMWRAEQERRISAMKAEKIAAAQVDAQTLESEPTPTPTPKPGAWMWDRNRRRALD